MRWRPAVVAHRAALALIVAAAAVVAFHPHWNPLTGESRDLPTHVDEHAHWGFAQQAQKEARVNFGDPFAGTQGDAFSLDEHLHERGFHVYLAALQSATGVPWETLFKLGPAATMALLALAAYAVGRAWDAGLEAALWVVAIPTSLRFLGPAFLVPIGFALPLLAAGILLVLTARGAGGVVAVAVVAFALWTIHGMAAVALLFVALAHAAWRARLDPVRAALLVLAVAAPLVLAWPYVRAFADVGVFTPTLPAGLDVVLLFGAAPLLLAAGGAALLLARGGEEAAGGAALGLLLLGCETIAAIRLATNGDVLRLYDRSLMVLFLAAALLAAVPLAAARRGLARLLARRPAVAAALAVALLAVQGAAVAHGVRGELEQPYYKLVADDQFRAFEAAAPVVGPMPGAALVDGPGTMAFTLATGKPTVYVHRPGSTGPLPDVRAFFDAGASDTFFILKSGATVVATQKPVSNPDLVEVAPGVYALHASILARLDS